MLPASRGTPRLGNLAPDGIETVTSVTIDCWTSIKTACVFGRYVVCTSLTHCQAPPPPHAVCPGRGQLWASSHVSQPQLPTTLYLNVISAASPLTGSS